MLFKLVPKAGAHRERNMQGQMVEYVAGEVVETDSNLAKRFPGKFIRIDNEQPRGGQPRPAIPVPHRFVREDVPPPVIDVGEGPVIDELASIPDRFTNDDYPPMPEVKPPADEEQVDPPADEENGQVVDEEPQTEVPTEK